MALHYMPRSRRTSSATPVNPVSTSTSSPLLSDADLEPSVFIFPAPASSSPSSPYATSSVLSVPTDFSFPSTSRSRSRPRPRRTRSGADGEGSSISVVQSSTLQRSISFDSDERFSSVGDDADVDVEIWDWTTDEHEQGAQSDAELEAAVERVSRWEALGRAESDAVRQRQWQFTQQRRPLGHAPHPNSYAYAYAEGRFRFRRRLRAESESSLDRGLDGGVRLRKQSQMSTSGAGPLVALPAPRIPLLGFFASLLALDEPVSELLERPTIPQSSILFSGPLLVDIEEEDGVKSSSRHNTLFVLKETSIVAVKEGIQVACDPSITPENRFALSVPSLSLFGVWSIVKGAYRLPVKVWDDVLRSRLPLVSNS